MPIADILNTARQITLIDPAGIIPAEKMRALYKGVADMTAQMTPFRLSPKSLQAMGLTQLDDQIGVLQAGQRFLTERPEFLQRLGVAPTLWEEVLQTHVAAAQGRDAFRRLGAAARTCVLVLSADLTERVDRVDTTVDQIVADPTVPAEDRAKLANAFAAETESRQRTRDLAAARRKRTLGRRAVAAGSLLHAGNAVRLLRSLGKLKQVNLPPQGQTQGTTAVLPARGPDTPAAGTQAAGTPAPGKKAKKAKTPKTPKAPKKAKKSKKTT